MSQVSNVDQDNEDRPLLSASSKALTEAESRPSSPIDDVSPASPTIYGSIVNEAQKPANAIQLAKAIMPLSVGIFLCAMDQTIVASSYASISSEMKQLQKASWIATAYMLTLTSFQPLYGKLCDIFGRKNCLLFAYSLFTLGNLLCGLARNMNELIAARALAGLGGGGMPTVGVIIVSDLVPLRARGTWQGLINIIHFTGLAVGAPLGGIFSDKIGWRWVFLIQVPAMLIAFTVVSFTLRLSAHTSSGDVYTKLRRVDYPGSLLLVLAVFALLMGLDRGGNTSWSDCTTLTALVSAAVFSVFFGFIETHPRFAVAPSLHDASSERPAASAVIAREPLAPKRILTNTALLAVYICNLSCISASVCALFHAALFYQAAAGYSAARAGAGLIPASLGGVLGSVGSGALMQKTGRYYRLTVGVFVSMIIGASVILVGAGVLPGFRSIHWVEAGLFVLFFGNGAGLTTTLVALIANITSTDQAVATAVSYLFRSLGSVLGISVGSTLVQNSLRSYLRDRLPSDSVDADEIARQVRSSLSVIDELDPSLRTIVRNSYEDAVQAAFWFSFGLAVLATVSSLFIKEKALSR